MNCIRCGREIPEQEMLCTVCKLPPVTVPAEAAPSPKEQRRETKKKKQQEQTKLASSPKVVRRLALALAITVGLLIGVAVFLCHTYDDYRDRQNDLKVREASVALREQEADNRDKQIDTLTKERDKLKTELERLKQLLSGQ